jgi:Tfp pilus assembly protein PilO
MMEIDQKQKIIILSAAGVIFLLAFIFLVIMPLSDRLTELKKEIQTSELELKEAMALQARKDLIIFQCNKFRDYLQANESSDQENEGWLLKEVEQLSERSFLSVISLSKADIKQVKDYKVYGAELRAEGDITSILKFFSYIEENPKLIQVADFTVSPKDEKANTLEFDANISLYVPQISISDEK